MPTFCPGHVCWYSSTCPVGMRRVSVSVATAEVSRRTWRPAIVRALHDSLSPGAYHSIDQVISKIVDWAYLEDTCISHRIYAIYPSISHRIYMPFIQRKAIISSSNLTTLIAQYLYVWTCLNFISAIKFRIPYIFPTYRKTPWYGVRKKTVFSSENYIVCYLGYTSSNSSSKSSSSRPPDTRTHFPGMETQFHPLNLVSQWCSVAYRYVFYAWEKNERIANDRPAVRRLGIAWSTVLQYGFPL